VKKRKLIYLDNAATSYPKPGAVIRAVGRVLSEVAGNPGRSGYAGARKADMLLYRARCEAASFFGLRDASRLVFTPGGTWSLNMALKGLLKRGDHVIATRRQHNAVARVLMAKRSGFKVTTIDWNGESPLKEEDILRAAGPNSRAIVVNHACNVDGLIFPLAKIGRIADRLGLVLIVDAAQTAGLLPIDMRKMNIGVLCATGHKCLMGPAGTGILAVAPGVDVKPLLFGGTGSFSEEFSMPAPYPDRLEAGSLNLPGIAGLAAGIREIKKIGLEKIFKYKTALCELAFERLSAIGGVKIYRPRNPRNRAPLFSFTIDGADSAEAGDLLDRKYGIACRVGLHCAPMAHMEIGTYPEGSIRFAPGFYTKKREIAFFVKAVEEIVRKKR
jgi:cysteine desulfurase family protein